MGLGAMTVFLLLKWLLSVRKAEHRFWVRVEWRWDTEILLCVQRNFRGWGQVAGVQGMALPLEAAYGVCCALILTNYLVPRGWGGVTLEPG